MKIAFELNSVMQAGNMSTEELSEKSGLPLEKFEKINSGEVRGVRLSTLLVLCETLNCEPGDLLKLID